MPCGLPWKLAIALVAAGSQLSDKASDVLFYDLIDEFSSQFDQETDEQVG